MNGLDPTNDADGRANNDDDSMTRGEEYIAGTSDFDGSDSLEVTFNTMNQTNKEWTASQGSEPRGSPI